jgi:ribosomal-protein-alanine N-acetyltransferase
MHYRLYLPGDFPQLYAIEQECFQPPFRFPRRYMQQLLANPNSAAWIAEDDHQMTGFAIANWAQHGAQTIAYIQTLEVAPVHRKKGIATQLLSRLESSAIAAGALLLWLHVAETNTPAIALYKAHGYRPKGREENFYAPGINALIYFKSIGLHK